FLGGIVVTNNSKRALLKVFNFPDDMSVLFHIPSEKAYTIETDVTTLRIISQQVELAFNEALNENYWTALTLNGLLHAAALKLDSSPTIEALRCGAVAAGITGKGPATVAVAATDRTEAIINAWKKFSGQVVKTAVNQKKAKILRRE
ncbi:MAG: shikimate kinase, partial [Candidatus Bathyarchaeia archaeon]